VHPRLLEILRCPYCGTALSIVENDALVMDATHVEQGTLGCECCAYPVVAGIPVLIADEPTRSALHTLEAGRSEEALFSLLGLPEDGGRRAAFRAWLGSARPTYREAVGLLCDDAEGTWCLYRFTDPTFVTAEALLRALGRAGWPFAGRVLDLCGGTGHMTRVLESELPARAAADAPVVVADVHFWKLWLASRFTAPGSAAVCCDANSPLPFARGTFSTVLLADAFPYIWHKRMLAEEMMRLVGSDGLVVMPHLHSALGENFSAGDTLSPAAYRDLFAPLAPRLFSDERLFDDVVERGIVDLGRSVTPDELGTEPSLTLLATPRQDLFRRHEIPRATGVVGALAVNPLYEIARNGRSTTLTLRFPTPEYEEEFAACRRYLPERVVVDTDLSAPITEQSVGPRYAELRERRVLIDAPVGF